MQRIHKQSINEVLPYFEAAAKIAKQASCQRAKCGTVIVQNNKIIGEGYNGPALSNESSRTCNRQFDLSLKPKYDKTCCIHAEWRAILDACKRNAALISGSVLYFMRIDQKGNFTDAGEPYCTTCSRLALESGVEKFALWNDAGADIYSALEYNNKSYDFYLPTQQSKT